MGSDIARRTFDNSRQYRRVVTQQGRVVIDADLNEAQEIITEETRKEALDIVGPCGTPDDGYKVTIENGPVQDLRIGPGTMYVGGMRVELAAPVLYSEQKEWLDGDPPTPTDEYQQVCLLLIEREVSAVEDKPLREVALGGPDTAQRTRLLQRFQRFGLEGEMTCEEAFESVKQQLEEEGLYFDFKTARLESKAKLRAKFAPPEPEPDACSPVGLAGYLGAENQLIRVQIAATNKLLWGFDNASFVYRVKRAVADSNAGTTLIELASSPVDAHHHPRLNQWVEILLPAAELDNHGDWVAASSGLPRRVVAAYNPVKHTFEIDTVLPASYLDELDFTTLFVRVWENLLDFVDGTAVHIGETGLEVTLTANGGMFVVGDYWMVAVRPGAPTQIFPQRYVDAPQLPEGPRRWICPLAMVAHSNGTFRPVDDCREPFDSLVELTRRRGCCTITVKPSDVDGGKGLQDLIDSYKPLLQAGTKVSVCLMAGTYELETTLQIGRLHSGLTISSCTVGGAVLKAKTEATRFLDGLISIVDASSITLCGIKFVMPWIGFDAAHGQFGTFTLQDLYDHSSGNIALQSLMVAIGVRVVHSYTPSIASASASTSFSVVCRDIRIEDCDFDYNGYAFAAAEVGFAAGVFLGGQVSGLHVVGNSFTRNARPAGSDLKYEYGCLHTSTTQVVSFDANGTSMVTSLWSSLENALFRDNEFHHLTAAVLVYADQRAVRAETNTIIDCCSGLWFTALSAWTVGDNSLDVQTLAPLVYESVNAGDGLSALVQTRRDECFDAGGALARAYPVPSAVTMPPSTPVLGPVVLSSLREMLSWAEAPSLALLAPGIMVVHVNGNEVRTTDGVALFVWAPTDLTTEVIVQGNRLVTQTAAAAAITANLGRATVNGNIIVNENGPLGAFSLAMLSITTSYQRAAITGNVFRRRSLLPIRPPQTPAVEWVFFNDEDP